MTDGPEIERRIVRLRGRVQGVGFRDHVVGVAAAHPVRGTVRNAGDEVEIDVEGSPSAVAAFLEAILARPPQGAHIADSSFDVGPAAGYRGFRRV